MKLQTKNVILQIEKTGGREEIMLKFHEDYSTANQSLEDFILVIFVLVDDMYKKVAPKSVKYRPNSTNHF